MRRSQSPNSTIFSTPLYKAEDIYQVDPNEEALEALEAAKISAYSETKLFIHISLIE